MKVLPIARILLIDSDAERRQSTRLGLTELGIGAVTEATNVAEARDLPRAFDVVVVAASSPDEAPEHPFKDTGDAVPAILIAEGTALALTRAAGRAGYDAALAMPVLPRLLYRRIGSVLQRARRLQRPPVATAEAKAAEGTSSAH